MNDLPNPLEEYFTDNAENKFLDLFEATEENIDLRTDLMDLREILILAKLKQNDIFLSNKLGFPLFKDFIEKYLRLKVSLERKSRSEFVDINRKDRFEQNLQRFGNFANLMKVKE